MATGFGKIAGERPEGSVVRLSEAKDFGHVYALDELWKKLGFSEALTQAGISGDTTFPVADTERRIRAHVFLCFLALQSERWMRKSLRSVSAQKAVELLRRIKAVTVTSPGGSSRVTTVVTAEQKDLLKRLGVPPLSGVLPESCSV
ncbi:MAG: hypothetical protein PHP88_12435 [bacterium]|nr:hypothetical protein [bacterium]